ncbi:helix-turn-helix domain-containing protein [Microbispora sp. NPDC046933]|uniref:ArsR/SmtB family transcription factor n=1 Tax=Microbispora sp. NPDC046933 TaxID=3155618 RepID=UPI0033E14BB2
MGRKTARITDPKTLKVIAHPARLRLYEVLVAGGPATAAQLARHVAGAPGSLSYHLRQLAAHGFIEEAPDLGSDGRERWWRAIPGGVRWSPEDFEDSPGAREVAATAQRVLTGRHIDRLEEWLATGPRRWGPTWASAARSTDTVLRLDPDELRELGDELDAVIARWANRPDDGSDREQVFLFLHAFPIEGSPPVGRSSDQPE